MGVSSASWVDGDLSAVERDPGLFVQTIYAELPRYLPVADSQFLVPLGDDVGTCEVTIVRRRRGEEEWSSLDVSHLPFFSRVVIAHGTGLGELRVLSAVLSYLNDMRLVLDWDVEPLADVKLSYIATYARKTAPGKPVAVRWHPLREPVHWHAPTKLSVVTEDLQLAVNKLRLEMAAAALSQGELWGGRGFVERVQWVFEEFSLYSRQHVAVVAALGEEQVRDLCLIPIKVVLDGEGEAFSLLGKTDMKVRNPANRRETAVAEFKKWDGAQKARDAFDQLVRRYATGAEKCLFLYFLSQNKDIGRVRGEALACVLGEAESVGPLEPPLVGATVLVRGREIPLRILVSDLYHAG